MPTEPLTGTLYPDLNHDANIAQIVQDAVTGLADATYAGPFATTTARDTAFSNWVAAGNTMRDYLHCSVTGLGDQVYIGGNWINKGGYYNAGAGTSTNLTTTPTAPTGGASLALPAGTFDIDIRGYYNLSVGTTGTVISLYLYNGGSQLFSTDFAVVTTGSVSSRAHADFTRITLASAATLTIRAGTSVTGGTQAIVANAIRARVA